MTRVPRIGRLLDAAGALVLMAGGGLVARAWIGFREVQVFEPNPDGPPMAALQLADRFRLIERTGVALMVIAVGVFVGAWWATRWISRQTSPRE